MDYNIKTYVSQHLRDLKTEKNPLKLENQFLHPEIDISLIRFLRFISAIRISNCLNIK